MKKTVLLAFFCIITFLIPTDALAAKPVIGISCCRSSSSSNVPDTYVISVRKAGGIPFIIPLITDATQAKEVLALVDGILFTGGEDVNPSRYGEPMNGTKDINEARDENDILLAQYAAEAGIPILGICRGEQVVNVALGGTLVQDIPSQVPGNLVHKQGNPGSEASQTMTLDPDSRLAKLLGATTVSVNSLHHQSVKAPAPGLKIVGRTSDGVVEAYEGTNIVGVQFHPEKFIAKGDDTLLPIFTDFIERAKNYRHENHSENDNSGSCSDGSCRL